MIAKHILRAGYEMRPSTKPAEASMECKHQQQANRSWTIVIAGSDEGMERVVDEARRQGARKAERLNVSVPSHCPLLQSVADVLHQRISLLQLRTPQMTYVGNVNARAMRRAERVANDLANNIAHSVHWHDATTVARELGCNLFLEMPPGHILSDLAKENLSGVSALAVESDVLSRVLRAAPPGNQ